MNNKAWNHDCDILIRKTIGCTDRLNVQIDRFQMEYPQGEKKEYYISLDMGLGEGRYDIKQIREERRCFLSYNGVIVPEQYGRYNNYRLVDKRYFKGGILYCVFALRGNLQPQMNLSRNSANRLDWEICSAINITVKKFFHTLEIYEATEIFPDLKCHLMYDELIKDKLVLKDWKEYKIIKTVDGSIAEFKDERYEDILCFKGSPLNRHHPL